MGKMGGGVGEINWLEIINSDWKFCSAFKTWVHMYRFCSRKQDLCSQVLRNCPSFEKLCPAKMGQKRQVTKLHSSWEWMCCHCLLYVRQDWNTWAIVSSQENTCMTINKRGWNAGLRVETRYYAKSSRKVRSRLTCKAVQFLCICMALM